LTPIASFKQPEKARILLKVIKENPRHPSLDFRKKGRVYTVEIGRS